MPQVMYAQGAPKLDGSLKQAAWSFIEKLSENDTAPGLHIEPIKNTVDERVRTGRVNQNFRAVLFKYVHDQGVLYVMHGIYPHDDAIEVAKKVRLTMNPVNGVPEVHVTAPAAEPVVPTMDAAPQEQPPKGYLAELGFLESELTDKLGIAPDTARRAMAAPTEDALLEVAAGAVQWQGLALIELASGKAIDWVKDILGLEDVDVPAAPSDEDIVRAFDRPAAKLQFAFIEDDEDLRRVIEEGDFAQWRTFLHPEQRRYAEGSWSGPFRLSGGAGTGKTVVLLHRARNLQLKNPDARIVLTTYSRTLAESLTHNLKVLDPQVKIASGLGEPGVLVLGVDQLSAAVLKAASKVDAAAAIEATLGSRPADTTSMPPNDQWRRIAESADSAMAPATRSAAFLEAEYAMVVLPQKIRGRDEYFKARRPGRGVALDRSKRQRVWKLVEAYRSAGAIGPWLDFTEKATVAAEVLNRTGPVADHVLVDEGQDLTPSQWQMLRAVAAPGQDDLFIAEDSHQRIFGQRVVLGRLGVAIVGRSRTLTLNYRTTAQNLAYALGVLHGDTFLDVEGETDSTDHYRSARSGPAPEVIHASSATDELDQAVATIERWIADGHAAESIGVLVRTNKALKRVADALQERGIPAKQVTNQSGSVPKDQVQVMTMFRAKGMEFECVLIFGVGADDMPAAWLTKDLEGADKDDAIQRERSLLYVSATRARDQLALVWSGKPSDMLPSEVESA